MSAAIVRLLRRRRRRPVRRRFTIAGTPPALGTVVALDGLLWKVVALVHQGDTWEVVGERVDPLAITDWGNIWSRQ